MMTESPFRVALLGCGVVGSQVARLLIEQADDLRERVGRPLELVGIAERDAGFTRPGIDPALVTTDADGLIARSDIVVELIGGIEPARSMIMTAFEAGASVVTANKALLAQDGPAIYEAAEAPGGDIYFEAAVAGAIPIVRPLRESLVGDEITAVTGIVNGTTNYILDRMTAEGASFADVLAQAQQLGYAEANPTADVEGYDAANKAAILASLAFHTRVTLPDVTREGITGVTAEHIRAAAAMNCVVKLLARCRVSEDGSVAVSVHPTMVPKAHPLAAIGGVLNAILIESRYAGQLMFMGPGAGGVPTASAVVGDVVTAARNRTRGTVGPGESAYIERAITPAGAERSRFYLSMNVDDQPGVLSEIAAAFARHGVSLQAVRQTQDEESSLARLSVMTHVAAAADVEATLAEFDTMPQVVGEVDFMRVEGV